MCTLSRIKRQQLRQSEEKEPANLPPQYKITLACGSWGVAAAATEASSVSAIVVVDGCGVIVIITWGLEVEAQLRGTTSRPTVPRLGLESIKNRIISVKRNTGRLEQHH